jgi:RNA polymerase sigma-70 factor (ECF subfamily)
VRRRGQGGTDPDGDGAAEDRRRRFEDLVTTNSAAMLGYVRRRVDQPADAADVVCDVFLVAWRRIDEVPEGRSATLWLYGVARRALANRRRGDERRAALHEKLRLQREIERVERVEPPDAPASDRVHEALARMSAIDREVLSLSAWEELTPAEIGAMTGLTSSAVRVRLHRARRRLKEMLETETAVTPPPAVGHVGTGQANAGPGMEEGR